MNARQSASRPVDLGRTIRPAEALAYGAVALGLCVRLALLAQPVGGDPAIYAYVGSRILAGALPYRDVFEQKPPGILYTNALALWTFGHSFLAIQLADFIAWAGLLALVPAIAFRIWRDRRVALVSAALAAIFINPTLQSSFKQVGQAETWISVWTAVALWLLLDPGDDGERSRPAAMIGVGIACGLAFLYKYNAALYLVAAAAAVLAADRRVRWMRVTGLVAGFAIPTLAVWAYFLVKGGTHDLYEATVLYNFFYTTESYDSPGDFAARAAVMTYRFLTGNLLWFTGWAGIVWLAWQCLTGTRRALPLILMALAGYGAILVNAKFYPQYFLQLLPLLAVASAFVLVEAARAIGHGGYRRLLAVPFLVGTVVVGRHVPVVHLADDVRTAIAYHAERLPLDLYYGRFGGYQNGGDFSLLADYRLAEFIKARTRPDDTVYIYGGEALVLFLADCRSPSRFVWNDPYFAGGPAARAAHDELVGELTRGQPKFVMVLRNDQNLIDPVDSITHYRADPLLHAYVEDHYNELGWQEDFLVFERAR